VIVSEKALAKLDFQAIREKLSAHCLLPKAKEWAEELIPVADIRTVRSLLRETDEGRMLLRINPLFSVRGAKEIRPYLERCERGGVLSPEELLEIRDTLKTGRQIHNNFLDNNPGNKDEYGELFTIKALIESFTPQKKIENEISRCLTEEGNISDRASEELARLRQAKNRSQQKIKETLDNILRNPRYQKMLQDNLITARGDRYVVPIKAEHSTDFPGIVHDQSASGATVFIEPLAVVELGNELREIMLKEEREIERIILQLTALVTEKVEEITELYMGLAKLDFILAKAHLSEDMEAGSPIVVNHQEIKLIRARHPLLKGRVVPISVELGRGYRFLVITGPNTGGKTVTLKTVGLLTVMMQSGLHIPAESESRLGIFQQVFVDIGDEQSVEQSLSTFSGHMTNIVEIMNRADDKSLVLFDELGAGTDPAEGAALAMAILAELLERGSCGIATSHYGALKSFAYNTPGIENASVEFNSETLKPTYRLLTGIPGRSNALAIADRLGLDELILEKARFFLSDHEIKESNLLENLEEIQREIDLQKRELEEQKLEAQQKAEELNRRRKELEQKYEEIILKAREEAVEIIRGVKFEAEAIVKEIKEAKKKERLEQERVAERARRKVKKLSERFQSPRKQKGGPSPQQIKPGQMVYIPDLRQKGQVLQEPVNNEVLIQAGVLKINVALSQIRLIDETSGPEHHAKTLRGSFGLGKAANLRSEIDIRGQLVEEAEKVLDKYLDDAVITGINQVSIIHGKGTGALRTGVHQFLKNHPHVRSYRLGEFGEGDSGVTIVELR
jgi:DNA mismatch repair protein MutS2